MYVWLWRRHRNTEAAAGVTDTILPAAPCANWAGEIKIVLEKMGETVTDEEIEQLIKEIVRHAHTHARDAYVPLRHHHTCTSAVPSSS